MMLIILTILALFASVALCFNGYIVIYAVPFNLSEALLSAVKVVVWSATAYFIGYTLHWWPFLLGFAAASALAKLQARARFKEKAGAHGEIPDIEVGFATRAILWVLLIVLVAAAFLVACAGGQRLAQERIAVSRRIYEKSIPTR